MRKNFTDLITDTNSTQLFDWFRNIFDFSFIWKFIYTMTNYEISTFKQKEQQQLEDTFKSAYKLTKISTSKNKANELAKEWASYIMYQETEATYLFIYGTNSTFLKDHLVVKNCEYISKDSPQIFVSPHWGAFYSIPVVLAGLGITNTPLSNGGETDHLKEVINSLTPEAKEHMPDILSTSNPIQTLYEFQNNLAKKQNLIVYPEYTVGPMPKYNVTYFGNKFPSAHGVAATAIRNNVPIQPLSLRRIKDTSKFELSFFHLFIQKC